MKKKKKIFFFDILISNIFQKKGENLIEIFIDLLL